MEPVRFPGRLKRLSGVVPAARAWVAAEWLCALPESPSVSFFLSGSMREAGERAMEVAFFRDRLEKQWRLLPFPPLPEPSGRGDGARMEAEWDRATVLAALLEEDATEPVVVFTTPEALLEPVTAPDVLRRKRILLREGGRIDLGELSRRLAEELGYDNEPVCERPGEFAVRGNLLDVYPVSGDRPVRIDFFGDEIESLRPFDPTTQLSEGSCAEISVGPVLSGEGTPDGSLAEYLHRRVGWVLEEPEDLRRDFPLAFEKPEKREIRSRSLADLFERPVGEEDSGLLVSEVECRLPLAEAVPDETVVTRDPETLREGLSAGLIGADRVVQEESARMEFLRRLARMQREGARITIVLPGESEEKRLREWMGEDEGLGGFEPEFLQGGLRRGVWREGEGGSGLYVTDRELFGRKRTRLDRLSGRALPGRNAVDGLLDFSEIVDGDTIVHLSHGICLYRGIRTVEIGGENREVIALEFAEGIRVSLPLSEAHLLSRYVGLSKTVPKLGKPGSGIWEKARRSAEDSTLDLAAQLLEIQAKRQTVPGHPFAPDSPWQRDFESAFPHRETADQTTAIDETKEDMEKPRPMDRLLCGDVGFGKTEVAVRAIFKAVMDGKQAALLVPTTVLCQQHFQTLLERFADYPVSVEMLSRFRSAGEQREIREQLREGRIDVVVGTHSLLGREVRFKELGLLVIDEEHRFGVKQKETLKRMRTHVDVLSMSATPIPRTLYLALAGARDLSVIETPPRDRLPVETYVRPYSEEIIRSAVDREIGRGGQVFYLHNRVQTIRAVEGRLREMFPRLRIAVGHGQMDEGDLEQVMTDFVAGRYDLLLCTTIIESGLDIPNSNTLIIEGADRFGLSQLYQLRGRVGRFNRQAYAYLLLHRHTGLLDTARKRLSAIRQYNQLGAGYRIAMRDLELRGAGNLIGSEQSGQIAGVGFDLYCQLLRQSIARLKGEATATHVRAEVRLDFVRRGMGARRRRGDKDARFEVFRQAKAEEGRIAATDAEIPGDYIPESRIRVDLYRRLGLVATREEMDRLEAEIADRFGPPPHPVKVLLLVTRIRLEAEYCGIGLVETEGALLRLRKAGTETEFVRRGTRFPRLTRKKPLSRLKEILDTLRSTGPK